MIIFDELIEFYLDSIFYLFTSQIFRMFLFVMIAYAAYSFVESLVRGL